MAWWRRKAKTREEHEQWLRDLFYASHKLLMQKGYPSSSEQQELGKIVAEYNALSWGWRLVWHLFRWNKNKKLKRAKAWLRVTLYQSLFPWANKSETREIVSQEEEKKMENRQSTFSSSDLPRWIDSNERTAIKSAANMSSSSSQASTLNQSTSQSSSMTLSAAPPLEKRLFVDVLPPQTFWGAMDKEVAVKNLARMLGFLRISITAETSPLDFKKDLEKPLRQAARYLDYSRNRLSQAYGKRKVEEEKEEKEKADTMRKYIEQCSSAVKAHFAFIEALKNGHCTDAFKNILLREIAQHPEWKKAYAEGSSIKTLYQIEICGPADKCCYDFIALLEATQMTEQADSARPPIAKLFASQPRDNKEGFRALKKIQTGMATSANVIKEMEQLMEEAQDLQEKRYKVCREEKPRAGEHKEDKQKYRLHVRREGELQTVHWYNAEGKKQVREIEGKALADTDILKRCNPENLEKISHTLGRLKKKAALFKQTNVRMLSPESEVHELKNAATQGEYDRQQLQSLRDAVIRLQQSCRTMVSIPSPQRLPTNQILFEEEQQVLLKACGFLNMQISTGVTFKAIRQELKKHYIDYHPDKHPDAKSHYEALFASFGTTFAKVLTLIASPSVLESRVDSLLKAVSARDKTKYYCLGEIYHTQVAEVLQEAEQVKKIKADTEEIKIQLSRTEQKFSEMQEKADAKLSEMQQKHEAEVAQMREEAARAQTEAARAQTEATRAQTEATQARAEVAALMQRFELVMQRIQESSLAPPRTNEAKTEAPAETLRQDDASASSPAFFRRP